MTATSIDSLIQKHSSSEKYESTEIYINWKKFEQSKPSHMKSLTFLVNEYGNFDVDHYLRKQSQHHYGSKITNVKLRNRKFNSIIS